MEKTKTKLKSTTYAKKTKPETIDRQTAANFQWDEIWQIYKILKQKADVLLEEYRGREGSSIG